MSDAPALWTPADFAAFAKLTPSQVKYLRLKGQGPAHVRLGKHVRYVPGAVRSWVLENQKQAKEAAK